MPAVYYHVHRVTAEDVDVLGHVNNLAYMEWMQSAALGHSAAQGWSGAKYRELGYGWVVRSHQIEYLQPAFLDQDIILKTWVADMQKVTSLRRYHILRLTESREIVLAEAATLTQDPHDREHVSLYIYEHPERYSLETVRFERPETGALRLTVDTEEDYELVRTIFDELYPANPAFGLTEILALLDARPELAAINQHIEQKAIRPT